MLKNLKEPILNLRKLGYSYKEISEKLQCNKSTVSYYCDGKRKIRHMKYLKQIRNKEHPLVRKIESFCQKRKPINPNNTSKLKINKILSSKIATFMRRKQEKIKPHTESIKLNDVLDKFGKNPKCYLTGDFIDLQDSKSYQLDHIMPYAKGGACILDNLGLTTSEANKSKADLTLEEYLEICSKVLRNFGYKVTKDIDKLES